MLEQESLQTMATLNPVGFYQGNEDGKVFLLTLSSINFESCSMRRTSLVSKYVDIGLMTNHVLKLGVGDD